MTSSMDVFNSYKLEHGLAVIVRQQTQGRGMYYIWHLINILVFNYFMLITFYYHVIVIKIFYINFKEEAKIFGLVQKVLPYLACNFMCLLIQYLEDEFQFYNI